MKSEIRIAPQNSLILIMDQSVGQIPESMNSGLVAATPSCVAVGTFPEIDGETQITLSDGMPSEDRSFASAFDGMLETPSKKLSVCSVLDEPLLTLETQSERTRVRVWVNHQRVPDEIHIVATGN